ncbi:hypothetical protein ONZ45_g1019 [Pleurotus djamor]|nr:hypothetical protein ONZ45_g1019 [Pleurotus djamor]
MRGTNGSHWPTLLTKGSLVLCFLCFLCLPQPSTQSQLHRRSLTKLPANEITTLLSSPDPLKQLDPNDPNSHLSKILIPRVSDTANNTLVREYIISKLKALKWHIEEDSFTDKTPFGVKRFTNIIATKDPTAPRRVILSAHFDSKYFGSQTFLGATDSAAPCAMMLDLAETLDPLLNKRKERLESGLEDDEDISDTTLQLVFFDGEEAFVQWTDTDSIYGARHLADKWENTYIAPGTKRRLFGPSMTELSTIEHLILLDLLGAPNPRIKSYFLETAWLFDAIADVEKRLGDSGAFAYGDEHDMAPGKWKSYFRARTGSEGNIGYMGDDHVPFLHRGVSILHIISEPFPLVWHTPAWLRTMLLHFICLQCAAGT